MTAAPVSVSYPSSRPGPAVAEPIDCTHTAGYNYVKIFDPTGGRNCSRAYSRQYEEREKWKTYLSQRLQKPKEEVTMKDWQRVNSFKYTSMIHVALDAGLRPIEIKRSDVQWVDTGNGVLRIPREESSKNRENWIVALKEETASILDRWLDERETREKYDGRDALRLTMYGNRYDKDSFRDVFRKIASEAGLDLENRNLTPYSIRHSIATYVAEEEGLAVAAQQCRHKSKRTTEKYEHNSTKRQQDAVNQID